jgi:transglutaminase-like putative cysteine protease
MEKPDDEPQALSSRAKAWHGMAVLTLAGQGWAGLDPVPARLNCNMSLATIYGSFPDLSFRAAIINITML